MLISMLILSVLVLIGIIGVISFNNYNQLGAHMIFVGILVLSGVLLVILAISYPVNYYEYKGQIQEFKSVQQTVENARQSKDISEIERASLTNKIIESNQWLARVQYDNKMFFEDGIPDEVDQLKPIK